MDQHRISPERSDQAPPRRLRRTLLWYGAGFLAVVAMLAACGPLGDDDEPTTGPAISAGGASSPVMSTFTATIPGTTPEPLLTAAVRSTERAATATYQAVNPQPTATLPAGVPTQNPDDVLTPPMALLSDGDGSIDSKVGSYSWVYDDAARSYARIDAPLMEFTEVALTTAGGSEMTMSIPDVAEPVTGVELGVYDFADNTAIPTDQSGQPGDSLMFSPRVPAVMETTLTSLDESFALDVPPGQYLIQARAAWPDFNYRTQDGQTLTFPLYITYVFNVIVE